jgi:hypothetical protein
VPRFANGGYNAVIAPLERRYPREERCKYPCNVFNPLPALWVLPELWASPALLALLVLPTIPPKCTVFSRVDSFWSNTDRTGSSMLANFEALRICLLKMNSRRHFRPGREHFWIFGP